jgi:hypothetical protein
MMQKRNKIFWRIGLEITPETFIQADNYICSQHNLIRRLIADGSYGIIGEVGEKGEAGEMGNTSFSVKTTLNNNDLYIEKLICSGTTGAGYLIDIDSELWASIPQKSLTLPDSGTKALYVVLQINPFEQVLVEPVIYEEAPAAFSAFELNVRELEQIGENELAILKINTGNYTAEIAQDFIPPCMSVNACSKLFESFGQLKKLLSEIMSHIEKRDELNSAALYPLKMLYEELNDFSPSNPPIVLIRLVKKIMQTYRFFVSDIRTVSLPDFLRSYNHNDISLTFKAMQSYLQEIIRVVSEGVEEDFTPKI